MEKRSAVGVSDTTHDSAHCFVPTSRESHDDGRRITCEQHITLVPLDSLLPADSPRLAGEDVRHVHLLAESEAVLPPVLVHRQSMRVIDGMHRLRAAQLRGEDHIRARFLSGSDADAFVTAVRANTSHGLPLTVADRAAAAARIVVSHPHWSDRLIGSIAGVSGKLVGSLRPGPVQAQPEVRIGRDGRARPRNGAAGRMLAYQLLREQPEASLRQVAKVAGISPATALDVRLRLRAGVDPLPARLRPSDAQSHSCAEPDTESPLAGPDNDDSAVDATTIPSQPRPADWSPARQADPGDMLKVLRDDPSLRFSETGRALLRWLHICVAGIDKWKQFVDMVPDRYVGNIAELAREASVSWLEFAEQLQQDKTEGAAQE